MKQLWRIWAKALGQKDGLNDREADRVAMVRTAIVVFTMITNLLIIVNVAKHWNDGTQTHAGAHCEN